MEKLNRLVWMDGLAINCYGVRIGLRSNDQAALDQMIKHLPPLWQVSSSSVVDRLYSVWIPDTAAMQRPGRRSYHVLYSDWTPSARDLDSEAVFDAFESDLQMFVAEMSPRRVFVHAGSVGWHGRAILIPGSSFSGKTTLVAALVRAGATYYSDEYALLDSHGRVHPYNRPLSFREASDAAPIRCSIEQLGGRAGNRPLPVGLVVLTNYRSGTQWRPRPLSKGQGVLALLEHTVPAQRVPQTVLRTLRQAVEPATVLRGTRGEADQLVGQLLQRLDGYPLRS